VPDVEMHANDADVHAKPEMQHDDDAFYLENDAMHGDERLHDVHGKNDGTFLQTMRNENDRLLRPMLHHDLQFHLHDDGNADG
jgi:hypothetical protein